MLVSAGVRAGPGPAALAGAGAAPVGLGRRGLRPGGGQRRSPRPTRCRCSANWRAARTPRCRQRGLPGRARRTGLHLLRADELSADELSTLQRWRACTCWPTAAAAAPCAGLGALHEALRCAQRGTAARRCGGPAGRDRRRPVTGRFRSPTAASSASRSADAMRPRGPGSTCWPTRLRRQLSEGGGGNTWAVNSRLNQLTAWSNDPVADPPGEWFLLQDRRTAQAWSVAPSAWGGRRCRYRVAHGQGAPASATAAATWRSTRAGAWTPTVRSSRCSCARQPRQPHARCCAVTGIAEWMMGRTARPRHARRPSHACTHGGHDPPAPAGGRLDAGAAVHAARALGGFGDGTAFLALARADADEAASRPLDWTCDRRELLRRPRPPGAARCLGQRSGSGLDPCAALSTAWTCARRAPSACSCSAMPPARWRRAELAALAAAVPPRSAWTRCARWDALLGATTVKHARPAVRRPWSTAGCCTRPCRAACGPRPASTRPAAPPAFATSCRTRWRWPGPRPDAARADPALRVAPVPRRRRAALVACPGGAGVRTHFSDDLLWLPFACVHYLRATATHGGARRAVPFIEGPPSPKAPRTPTTPHGQRRAGQRLRTRGPHHRPQPARGRARPAADGQRRLERRHEPRRPRGPRRIGVAGLVPVRLVGRLRAAGARSAANAERAGAGKQAARAGGGALRARPGTASWFRAPSSTTAAAGIAGQCRRPHRPDRAGLVGAVGAGAAGRAAHGHGRGGGPPGGRRGRPDPLLDPPLAHASRAPATSRPTRRACARTAASTPMPACGR
jgi:hypothetical protein